MRQIFTLCFLILSCFELIAQNSYSQSEIQKILLTHSEDALTESAVQDIIIERQYTDSRTGHTYIYVSQAHEGIPIFNAIASIGIAPEATSVYVKHRFIQDLQVLRKNNAAAALNPELAVRHAFKSGGLNPQAQLTRDATRSSAEQSVYTSALITEEGARVEPVYFLQDNELTLTWDVSYFPQRGTDYWSMRIGPEGHLIDQTSFTVHCRFDGANTDRHEHHRGCVSPHANKLEHGTAAADGAQYNIFPLPVESPLHGSRQVISNPADSIASPFGWHDENGIPGNETTVTEGNNARAWLDRAGDFNPDRDVEGGASLIFDFPYDGTAEPFNYPDAATANLFYMVNMMHDITYAYGFDEVAGNFQLNNYGKGGDEGDPVRALAQYSGDTGANLNNADFSTPSDGGQGTMRMFLWTTRNDISVFTVTEPTDLAGIYPSRTANFGTAITDVPFEGEVVLVDDESGVTTDACQEIKNDAEIAGKIAMIDRGDCEFGFKILNAEQDGAIGAIICNNIDGLLSGQMGAGAVGNQVTIPSVFISKADCARLRVHAGAGLTVKFQTPPGDDQPNRVDGSLDNGIIAHEFAHGISNRLTGGPGNTNCLRGFSVGSREEGEQMGEGWSDYFSLVTTVEPGDQGTDARGIGNYALRNEVDGSGIRTYPYSIDMTVNPVTYYDIYDASIPHGLGHVWCSMIWDMYWLFVERHGWDPDVIHGNKGNNMAIQLVMDGMKLQPCEPGFVDGRDGILAADMMNYNGANQDIIWEAFARRGLGQHASQGESSLVADGKEDYSIPPQFIASVKLAKKMTPVIQKGEDIEVVLEVRNDLTQAVTDVEIVDFIPAGTAVDMSTLPSNATIDGDRIVFQITALESAAQLTLPYKLQTPAVPSTLILYDDFESPDTDGARWISNDIEGNTFFNWVDDDAKSGSHAWKIANVGPEHEQSVFNFFEVSPSGNQPVLRFSHKYNTDKGNDGGIFEISTDYLVTLEDLGPHMFRQGYNNNMRLGTFPGRQESAFTGDSDGWIDTYVDLSDYLGAISLFQFRFATDEEENSDFWVIDDFTLFDALNYNSEACLMYAGSSDMICAEAEAWGTIVEPEEFTSVDELANASTYLRAYPNPARDVLNLEIKGVNDEAHIQITDVSGRTMFSQKFDSGRNHINLAVSMAEWSNGMYIVQLTSGDQQLVEKISKQ